MRSFRLLIIGVLAGAGACCDDYPNAVYAATVSSEGGSMPTSYRVFLSTPDSIPLTAEAWSLNGWFNSCMLYTLDQRPEGFSFASTDSMVATIEARGVVRAHGPGEAVVSVMAGLGVWDIRVLVSPSVGALRVTAPALASPGDTIEIDVAAFDQAGRSIEGVYVFVSVLPPTDSIGQWSSGYLSWESEVVRTPDPARLILNRGGTMRVVATTAHEPGYSFIKSDTAEVEVTGRRRSG